MSDDQESERQNKKETKTEYLLGQTPDYVGNSPYYLGKSSINFGTAEKLNSQAFLNIDIIGEKECEEPLRLEDKQE